jgi:hypothetical protein
MDVSENKGLIQFPSYHTAAAILAINAFRFNRLLFTVNLAVSALLILAVPTFGSHYVADVLAGGAVAGFAIWTARRLVYWLSHESIPIMRPVALTDA